MGKASDFSVAGGAGVMTTAGGWDQMQAPVDLRDTEVLVSFWWAGGDPTAVEVFTRYTRNSVRYATTIWWGAGATFEVSMGANRASIVSREDTGITSTAGQKHRLRVRTIGANPTNPHVPALAGRHP
jgi:hypothetical protein